MIIDNFYVYSYGLFLAICGFYFGYEVAIFNSWAVDFIKNVYKEENI